MKVKVMFFAAARQVVGQSEMEVDLPADSTIVALKNLLLQKYPELNELMAAANWSVNHVYVPEDGPLEDGCEVGMILPVSGG